jgi:hypothetical protein
MGYEGFPAVLGVSQFDELCIACRVNETKLNRIVCGGVYFEF